MLHGVTQSFRFEDDNNYEYYIFSVLSSAHAGASVILAGKSDSRRHFTTGFSKSGGNKLLNVRSFIILQKGEGLTSFSIDNRADIYVKKSKKKISGVSFFRTRAKTLSSISLT